MKRLLFVVIVTLWGTLCAVGQLNTDRLMSVGRSALYFEDYVLSIQYFNQVIRVKPQLVDPYFFRGIAKISLEDFVGAEADFDIVIERSPFIPMAYYARGFALSNMGRWSEAAMDFSMALQYSPDNVYYLLNRVRAFTMDKRYIDAIADIDYLLKIDPNSTYLKLEKGVVLLQSGDTLSAYNNYKNLILTDSLDAEVWGAYATSALLVKHENEAINAFDKAVSLGTENPMVFINRGTLNYRKHNYKAAISDYNRAIELDTISIYALFNRALIKTDIGDYNGAIADLDKVEHLDPNTYEAIYQRAIIYSIIGDYAKSIKDYSHLLERYPTFVPALYARADLYDKQGNQKAAFIDRQKAYDLRLQAKKGLDAKTDSISVNAKISTLASNNSIKNIVKLFRTNPNEPIDDVEISSRGTIQNRNVSLNNEPNIGLSYYLKNKTDLLSTIYNPQLLQQLNESGDLVAKLYLVAHDVQLSKSMIEHHFESINKLSKQIDLDSQCSKYYFARAIDYAIIQDFQNSIEDFSKTIQLDNHNALAYFSRANVRYKQLEFEKETEKRDSKNVPNASVLVPMDASSPSRSRHSEIYEMIMRDYDYTLSIDPDFAFAWYNRANLLAINNDYKMAIDNYSRAIRIEPLLAEAYFNRGLLYILVDEIDSAIKDLSKAGELGIYKSYSIIKKLQSVQ